MITCVVRYEIAPKRLEEFEAYAALWLAIVPRLGGIHHGYFLPSEGSSDIAYAIFSFESLASYERYREALKLDPGAREAGRLAVETDCIRRYDRNFFRPVGIGLDSRQQCDINH